MKKLFDKIEYKDCAEDALIGADACIVMTDWDEFKELDAEFEAMNRKIIIEGRKVVKDSIEHEGICW